MRKTEREAAYVDFVTARQTHLRRIAYAVCGDWDRADDVLQTALTKLYVAWPRIRKVGNEDAYVRQIIMRANIDEHRRPWRREWPSDVESELDTPVHDDVEDHTALFAALQQLPVSQRKTVLLRHWIGLSVEETAAELGISAGTVKSHTSRALDKLQATLTAEGH